jgi:hypothetical protein
MGQRECFSQYLRTGGEFALLGGGFIGSVNFSVTVIDKVVDDRIKKFREEEGARWTPDTWKTFFRLIDPEAQKKHLGPVTHLFRPPS